MNKNLILLIADIVLFLVIVTSWRSQNAAQSRPSAGTAAAQTEASAKTKAPQAKAEKNTAEETRAKETTAKEPGTSEAEAPSGTSAAAETQEQNAGRTEEFHWVPQSEQTRPQSEQARPQSQAGGNSAPSDSVLTGGSWEQLPSAEWIWKTADGRQVSDAWVSDGGKYYYIDLTGCMMRNNYASNGAWVGDDGAWDPSVTAQTEIAAPLNGERYGKNPYWAFDYQKNNSGSWTVTATKTYSFGNAEVYTMEHLAGGSFLLTSRNDPAVKAQLTVSADQHTIRISQYGTTEVCDLVK